MTNLDSILKSRDWQQIPSSQGYGFSSGHVWMWELDYKESWVPKNRWFSTVVLEKTLVGPLDCKEIQPVHPKADQSWVFIGRTDAEAETTILWPPDVKSWLIWKDPDAGKDWGQVEKRTTEDDMVGWHHRLNGHGFGWTPGVGDGQGGLACCSSWGCRVRHDWLTERTNFEPGPQNESMWCGSVLKQRKNVNSVKPTTWSIELIHLSTKHTENVYLSYATEIFLLGCFAIANWCSWSCDDWSYRDA